MARKNPDLIDALRETADRLDSGARYEWGHMGRCNCGHLVQTLTDMSASQLVASIDHQLDEWSEHARDYCQQSGGKVDDLFLTLEQVGFDPQDAIHLENLSDREVLLRLNGKAKTLRKNRAQDVSIYMRAMADHLEGQPVC